MTKRLSCCVTYRPDLSGVFELSGKHLQIRIAIYLLNVFPNVALWQSASFRDAGRQQESKP
jgi:hypothetical protein